MARSSFFVCPTTTKLFIEPTHLSSRENTGEASVIFTRSCRLREHEMPTRHNHLNLAMLHSKCQLTPAMLLRGFLVRFGGKRVRERVWAALEYPRVTCENHHPWVTETIDGLICRLHSFSIKNIPAHCCPVCNSRSHCKTLRLSLSSLADHVLQRVSYVFGR